MMEKFKKIALGFFGTVLCGQMAQAEVSYVHSDHLGSTSVATNSAGTVQQVAIYSPYGAILRGEERGEGATAYLYTGQELDRGSNLSYYGARYYDPTLSRFLSIDLVQGNLPYTYVNNNPIILIDPDGNIPLIPILLGFAVGGMIGLKSDGADDPLEETYDAKSGGVGAVAGATGVAVFYTGAPAALRLAARYPIPAGLLGWGGREALNTYENGGAGGSALANAAFFDDLIELVGRNSFRVEGAVSEGLRGGMFSRASLIGMVRAALERSPMSRAAAQALIPAIRGQLQWIHGTRQRALLMNMGGLLKRNAQPAFRRNPEQFNALRDSFIQLRRGVGDDVPQVTEDNVVEWVYYALSEVEHLAGREALTNLGPVDKYVEFAQQLSNAVSLPEGLTSLPGVLH
ncbi:MAG: RHS repeat-associated core domain-containing protein [Deltaproteobacteria bacterium]|nr:RHS repeat-associated core domain-containing protein [Deltaproteobacteria bacterium]